MYGFILGVFILAVIATLLVGAIKYFDRNEND